MKYFIAVFVISPILLLAHPHIFIDVNAKIDGDRIYFEWEVDEIKSAMMKLDYDLNQDGSFDKEELGNFKKSTDYMLYERTDFFISPKKKIENLSISWRDNKFTILFDIIIKEKKLYLWDREMLFSFHLNRSDIKAIESNDYYGYEFYIDKGEL